MIIVVETHVAFQSPIAEMLYFIYIPSSM